jgi:sugar O-acyltransferase (sialic acid O-acetyltransferase NeuD family)
LLPLEKWYNQIMPEPVLIPLLNTNEPEALLVTLYISEGQQVAESDPLCTLETTKSTADVLADTAGFVVGLRVIEGQTVYAGDVLCYLAESPDWIPPEDDLEPQGDKQRLESSESDLPPGMRITQPALRLAQVYAIDLSQLPTGPMITESTVRSLIESKTQSDIHFSKSDFDPMAMIIFGGGGHGKACLDLVRSLKTYRVVGFVDDGIPVGKEIMGTPVLGGGQILAEIYSQGIRLAVNAVGGIGNVAVRIKVFGALAEIGFVCPAIVHPTAFIEASASLSPGVQVFPHAYVGSEARVGFGSIVNTGAIISHDCELDEVVNISPGAILAGEVQVGPRGLIGMGVTVNLQVKIGDGARIGNGATVKSDVPENGIVPAGGIWPR